jgi:anti-sigma factor RsiW
LSPRDQEFFDRHLNACERCRAEARLSAASLDLLRSAALEVEVTDSFEDRLVRLARNRAAAESLRYWSPALIGAALAGIAMLAALQIVTRGSSLPPVNVPGAETRRYERPNPYAPPLGPDATLR